MMKASRLPFYILDRRGTYILNVESFYILDQREYCILNIESWNKGDGSAPYIMPQYGFHIAFVVLVVLDYNCSIGLHLI